MAALAGMTCRAQERKPEGGVRTLTAGQHITPYRIGVPFSKTVHVLFPAEVRYVDLGSTDIIAGKADGVENVVRVKAAVRDFPGETNFSVITGDGSFYSFLVSYEEEPEALNINMDSRFPTGPSTGGSAVRVTELGEEDPSVIASLMYTVHRLDRRDDEAFGIFQNFFAGPKPLIGVFSLKDLKTSSALLDVSLDKLNITNPSTSPYALEVSLEHLKMPVALVPELQLLSVMGVPEIDASASYAMSLPNKDNQFNSTASLSVAKLGTADFAVKGEFPYEEFLEIVKKTKSVDDPATEDAIENFVEKNIKFSHIEAGYADEGLLPRLGILGQKFMGLTPEQCVDMAKKYVKESLGAAEGTENTAKLMEYIDKPGAIRLIFNTEKPIPVEAFDTLSDTDPSIKLDVNTGPKTALELMADLEKK